MRVVLAEWPVNFCHRAPRCMLLQPRRLTLDYKEPMDTLGIKLGQVQVQEHDVHEQHDKVQEYEEHEGYDDDLEYQDGDLSNQLFRGQTRVLVVLVKKTMFDEIQ
ncbi:hypothetical protein PI126_g21643 [Phytophthora idaei]|nr:hypothetical protein PI126_g21643 [Phytophthora idaei]